MNIPNRQRCVALDSQAWGGSRARILTFYCALFARIRCLRKSPQ